MDELQSILNEMEDIEDRIQESYRELEDLKIRAKKIYQEIGKAYGLIKEKKPYIKKINSAKLTAVQ